VKLNLTDRRAMLGRLTLELTNKRTALTQGEMLRLKALNAEIEELETDIGFEQNRKYRAAFTKDLRCLPLTEEERSLMVAFNRERRQAEARSRAAGLIGGGDQAAVARAINAMQTESESRDLQVGIAGGAYPGSPVGGGNWVPVEMAETISSALKDYPIYRLATIFDTESGAPRAYPGDSDASISSAAISSERLAEGQAVSIQDIPANQVILGAYRYSTGLKISTSLVQDFGFPIEDYLSERFAIRIGYAFNVDATTGTGVNQPLGFLTAASSAGTAVGASGNDGVSGPNTLGTADFATLEAAVDPAYRRNAVWQMHSSTLAKLRSQLDREGRPVFAGLQNSPDGVNRIFNTEAVVNNAIAPIPAISSSPAVATTVLAYGDVSKYIVRRAPPILLVLRQRFASEGQIGYILFWRQDGNLIDGGGGAIKTMQVLY
jgi:HK97 family phage major capsid protein